MINRILVKIKYRKYKNYLPKLEDLEKILMYKFNNPFSLDLELKKVIIIRFKEIYDKIYKIVTPEDYIDELRNKYLKEEDVKKINEFLKEGTKILVNLDVFYYYPKEDLNFLSLLVKRILEGLSILAKVSSRVEKISFKVEDPNSLFIELSRELEDFPKNISEFEREVGYEIEDYNNIEKEVCELLFSRVNEYLSILYEKISGEGESLIVYLEFKMIGEKKRNVLLKKFKEYRIMYYNAYLHYLKKEYKKTIKLLWKLYKKSKEDVIELINKLINEWKRLSFDNYDISI